MTFSIMRSPVKYDQYPTYIKLPAPYKSCYYNFNDAVYVIIVIIPIIRFHTLCYVFIIIICVVRWVLNYSNYESLRLAVGMQMQRL